MKRYLLSIAMLCIAGLLHAADSQRVRAEFRNRFEAIVGTQAGQERIAQLRSLQDDIDARIDTLPDHNALRMDLRNFVERRIVPKIRQVERELRQPRPQLRATRPLNVDRPQGGDGGPTGGPFIARAPVAHNAGPAVLGPGPSHAGAQPVNTFADYVRRRDRELDEEMEFLDQGQFSGANQR